MSHELALFGTPWHQLVHGIGLGQNPKGFDTRRAAQLTTVSNCVSRRFPSVWSRFVNELVHVIVSYCEASTEVTSPVLMERLAALQHPCDHARACALVMECLAKTGLSVPSGNALQAHWTVALQEVAMLPASSDADRYRNLHHLVSLLLAGAQSGWIKALGSLTAIRACQRAWDLVEAIQQPFYRTRGAAILLTVLGLLPEGNLLRQNEQDHLADLMDAIGAEFARDNRMPFDGVHQGRDYQVFPLLLALTTISVNERVDFPSRHRDWLPFADQQIKALRSESRASQTLFWVLALRNLGEVSTYIDDPASFLQQTIDHYFASTDGNRPDDCLRCTYLVHLARELGYADLVPDRVWEIVAGSVMHTIGSERYRDNPYASGIMLVSYALSAFAAGEPGCVDNIDLAKAVLRIVDRPATVVAQLPRLGFAMVDAALCLRDAGSGDTPLFKSMRLGSR